MKTGVNINIVIGMGALFSGTGRPGGITQYLTREIARDRSNANLLFWNSVVLRFLLAIVASIVTTISAIMIGYSPEIVIGCIFFTTSYLFQAIARPTDQLGCRQRTH